jgi:hypothetical protein
LTDSALGFGRIQEILRNFLASSAAQIVVPADTQGSPAPYEGFLSGLRVLKGVLPQLRIADDGYLELVGSTEDLGNFVEKLMSHIEHGHRHWYSSPVSLIIQTSAPDEI